MPAGRVKMKPAGLAIAFSLSATLLLGACARTTYQGYGAPDESAGWFERRVEFHLSSAYFRTPPRCAAIRADPAPAIPAAVRRAVAGAVERHLSTRLARVMGPARTRQAARRLGLDPDDPADRKMFARRTGCDAMIRVRIENLSDDYFLVWSRRALSISLEMIRSADGALLWKARHRADRADGGVPFSLFSAPFAAFRAARLSGDREVFESIADDAIRRMTATLPDLRAAPTARPAARQRRERVRGNGPNPA